MAHRHIWSVITHGSLKDDAIQLSRKGRFELSDEKKLCWIEVFRPRRPISKIVLSQLFSLHKGKPFSRFRTRVSLSQWNLKQ